MAGEDGKKYAYLDQMRTEELEELLRADFESPERGDEGVILHILEVIEQREQEHPTGRLPDTERAWDEFQRIYHTPEGAGRSLYPAGEAAARASQTAAPAPTPFRARPRRRLRRVLVAAAVAAILVAFALPPALGYESFFQMVGQWTGETFQFRPDGSAQPQTGGTLTPRQSAEYQSLQEALDDYGITEKVVPKVIPEGYILDSVSVREFPTSGRVTFSAYYENSEAESISISVKKYDQPGSSNFEKDDTPVVLYSVGGIDHYIFGNCGYVTVAWYVGNLECSMTGSSDEIPLEDMIDSIYER